MRKEGMTKQALSSMAYFFLRMAFAKENYPESVLEELQWVVDDLLSEDPDDGLLEAVREEFVEGDYLHTPDSFPAAAFPYTTFQEMLMKHYQYHFDETQPLVNKLSAMHYHNGRPLVVLVKRSGVAYVEAAQYLHDKYSWELARPYTTKPCDQKDKDAYNVFTEKEMSLIPEWEVASYAETEGRQYCVTRLQLGMADLYVTDWIGCQILRKWYHDRPLYIIMTDAADGVLIKRMMERGSTETEAFICVHHERAALHTVSADVTIQVDEMSAEDLGETIKLLFQKTVNSHTDPQHAYLDLYIHDIQWDTSDDDYDPDEDDEPDLPETVTVFDRFRAEDYKNEDGSINEHALSDDVSDWLSNEYGFCHGEFQMQIIG